MPVMNTLRQVADTPALRGVLLNPSVRATGAKIASARFLVGLTSLEHPVRVAKQAWFPGDAVVRAELKDSDITLVLRAAPSLFELLYEIFTEKCYLPADSVRSQFSKSPRILDIGANSGTFAGFALTQWPEAAITCVEPDPANLAALAGFKLANPSFDLRIVAAAAATHDGHVNFQSGLGAGSRIVDSGTPTEAVDIFPYLEECDFVKMDIEGGEWPILEDERFRELDDVVLVMEYHRRFPDDKGAADAARTLLEAAGFTVSRVQPNYWGHGLLWAVKGLV